MGLCKETHHLPRQAACSDLEDSRAHNQKCISHKELGNVIHSKKQDESGKTYTVMIAELELIGKDLRTVVTGKFRAGQMAQLVKEFAL